MPLSDEAVRASMTPQQRKEEEARRMDALGDALWPILESLVGMANDIRTGKKRLGVVQDRRRPSFTTWTLELISSDDDTAFD